MSFLAANLFDNLEDGHEKISVIVAVLSLDDGGNPLQSHSRVHVLAGQGLQLSCCLSSGGVGV